MSSGQGDQQFYSRYFGPEATPPAPGDPDGGAHREPHNGGEISPEPRPTPSEAEPVPTSEAEPVGTQEYWPDEPTGRHVQAATPHAADTDDASAVSEEPSGLDASPSTDEDPPQSGPDAAARFDGERTVQIDEAVLRAAREQYRADQARREQLPQQPPGVGQQAPPAAPPYWGPRQHQLPPPPHGARRDAGPSSPPQRRQQPPQPGPHWQVPPPPARPMTPGRVAQSGSVGPLHVDIREADLVKPHKDVPTRGWRKVVYKLTRINVGVSPAERRWNDLNRRIATNLRGDYLIGVLQIKGGVSKTTTAIGLGQALSRYRDDKIAAIDVNPASGNLKDRIDEPSEETWRGLVGDPNLNAYSDLRHYMGRDTSTGLEVLAADHGDGVLTGPDVKEIWTRIRRHYPIGIVDCGTQLRDDVTEQVLAHVDAVVVVSTTRLDGARAAQETLNWLATHGCAHLVRSAVLVISDVNKVTPDESVKKLREGFSKAVHAVHDVPFDPHLSEAAAINFDRLRKPTQRAFIEAAASLVDGFASAPDKDAGHMGQAWLGQEGR